MRAEKRAFSLLEVIVSLVLIAIAAAVLIMPNRRALNKKQFSSAMSQLAYSTKLAKQVAFNCDTTITLHFDMEKDVLVCHFECDEALKESFRPLEKEIRFKGIKTLYRGSQNVDHLALHYVSKAGLQESGSISIKTELFQKPIALGID